LYDNTAFVIAYKANTVELLPYTPHRQYTVTVGLTQTSVVLSDISFTKSKILQFIGN